MIFVWNKNLDRSFFRFVTIHAFDRRTDRRTEFSSLDRVCISCNAVKTQSVVTGQDINTYIPRAKEIKSVT